MLKKMKNNKKGFTLVELIVVLVILAILAALLIPALTGYIDKAKEKSITAETRQVVMATQTLVDEEYGALSFTDAATAIAIEPNATAGTSSDKKVTTAEIAKLAEVGEKNIVSGEVGTDGKVTEIVYSKGGMTCTYSSTNNTYTITKENNTRN